MSGNSHSRYFLVIFLPPQTLQYFMLPNGNSASRITGFHPHSNGHIMNPFILYVFQRFCCLYRWSDYLVSVRPSVAVVAGIDEWLVSEELSYFFFFRFGDFEVVF